MLEETLKVSLTKEQRAAGLSLSESDDHTLTLNLYGRPIAIFGIHATIIEIRKEADKHFNHKDTWCPYSLAYCQAGLCLNCHLFPK